MNKKTDYEPYCFADVEADRIEVDADPRKGEAASAIKLWAFGPYEMEIDVFGVSSTKTEAQITVTLSSIQVRALIGQLQAFLDSSEDEFPATRP